LDAAFFFLNGHRGGEIPHLNLHSILWPKKAESFTWEEKEKRMVYRVRASLRQRSECADLTIWNSEVGGQHRRQAEEIIVHFCKYF
jgi:hypothetical protein